MSDKPIVFSKHAKRQMAWRGVTESEVEITIRKPDKIKKLHDEEDKYVNIKLIGVRNIKTWYYDFEKRIFIKSACVNIKRGIK